METALYDFICEYGLFDNDGEPLRFRSIAEAEDFLDGMLAGEDDSE